MALYKPRKPEIVEAIRYDGTNHEEIRKRLEPRCNARDFEARGRRLFFMGDQFASSIAEGEWLVYDIRFDFGFSIMQAAWFEEQYEPAADGWPTYTDAAGVERPYPTVDELIAEDDSTPEE